MTQRIYWVPHTVCPFGCSHCHNDSRPDGLRSTPDVIDRIIDHLPGDDSPFRLEEVLIGGGDGLARGTHMEHLVSALRQRFPQGPQATAQARQQAGHVILAIQTAGPPLADARGGLRVNVVRHWLDLGVDYFQVASSDLFHRSRRPTYPWDALEDNMRRYSAEQGVEFRIYGKAVTRLVPSGRVLSHMPELAALGADLLTTPGYCANGWETGSHFLSGQSLDYPQCSEVVIDPQGGVHPCCWYLLSPALFDLTEVAFEAGMQALAGDALCQHIDRGDMSALAQLAHLSQEQARQARSALGDCGLCRLASLSLAQTPDYAWIEVPPLSVDEKAFFMERLVGFDGWIESLSDHAEAQAPEDRVGGGLSDATDA